MLNVTVDHETCLKMQKNYLDVRSLFSTIEQNPVATHTFLKDNDKLVTKHMGQAMLGWWSVALLPQGQGLLLGQHVCACPVSQNNAGMTLEITWL